MEGWILFIFKNKAGNHYLVNHDSEEKAWQYLCKILSKRLEVAQRDWHLEDIWNGCGRGYIKLTK